MALLPGGITLVRRLGLFLGPLLKTWGFPSHLINQPRGLWPHSKSAAWGITPERVSSPEPLDFRPRV